VPVWQPGAQFAYTVYTWDGADGQRRSQLVNAVNTGVDDQKHQYNLAADTQEDAISHAVDNGFPFLGRVTTEDLRVYEDGAPQPLFGFWPLAGVATPAWDFRLFGTDWRGAVQSVDQSGNAAGAGRTSAVLNFVAEPRNRTTGTKRRLQYSLDVGVGFLSRLALTDAAGDAEIDMTLNNYQPSGYTGQAYFVRATDLYDTTWQTADGGSGGNATFEVGQHRTDGPWDMLVYLYDVVVGCDSSDSAAALSIAGAAPGAPPVRKFSFVRCAPEQRHIDTIRPAAGQPLEARYAVRARVAGNQTEARLRVAGGMLYEYTV
jgi:hypothetical protein